MLPEMKAIKWGSRACSRRCKSSSPGAGHAPGDESHQVGEQGVFPEMQVIKSGSRACSWR
jgi:hypothetical protein